MLTQSQIEHAVAAAGMADLWVPACGGTEVPFTTRTGRRLLYVWNPQRGHAYLDCDTDLILTSEEVRGAFGQEN